MKRFALPRCPKINSVRKMSGRGGFPSTWTVETKCRFDSGHDGPCDFTRGKRRPGPAA